MKETLKYLLPGCGLILLLAFGCSKEITSVPEVTTVFPRSIGDTFAISGGQITNEGSSPITQRGVVWDSVVFTVYDFSDTTLFGSKKRYTSDGTGIGDYSSVITGLNPGTAYFVRSYVKNEEITSFGDMLMFVTAPDSVRTIKDVDGNEYHTLTYYWQVADYVHQTTWFMENLKVKKYNNGDPVPVIKNDSIWHQQTKGAACYYEEKDNFDTNQFGLLYNWHAVNDARGLCPDGWHVAGNDDWENLITFLDGPKYAGGEMKEAGTLHWVNPNSKATNVSRFTALPGGGRSGVDGSFNFLGEYGNFWTSDLDQNSSKPIGYFLYYNAEHISNADGDRRSGLSVRCVKND